MLMNEIAIGIMIINFHCDDVLHRKSAEISAIYLLKDYWGSGFGKLFLNWGTDKIRELGYANVFLWVLQENIKAINFYKHHNFEFDGTKREIIRGKSLTQLRYQKLI
jgi:GNAT superfamily N-acetyltransferase